MAVSGPRESQRTRYETWLAIIGITVLSFAIRYVMLDRYPAPPSGDFGNYLNIVNIIEGTDVTGHGLRYPPLFFLILAPFINLLGPLSALKIVAAAIASSSCIPMFLLAKRWSNYPGAVSVTLLFTFSQAMAEMTAWGEIAYIRTRTCRVQRPLRRCHSAAALTV